MNKKHPHDKIIRGYLDGKTIQVLELGTTWVTLPLVTQGVFPDFNFASIFRFKPEPIKTNSYRRYIYQSPRANDGYEVGIVRTDEQAETAMKIQSFVEWIDFDWKVEFLRGTKDD